MDRGPWWGTVDEVAESDTTDQLSTAHTMPWHKNTETNGAESRAPRSNIYSQLIFDNRAKNQWGKTVSPINGAGKNWIFTCKNATRPLSNTTHKN